MYVGEVSEEQIIDEKKQRIKLFDKPAIIQSKNNFEKAREHFAAFDYPAAGNYLRKHLENLVKKALPKTYRYDESNGEESTKLEFLLNQLVKLFKDCGKETELIGIKQGIDLYKNAILNPASHYDIKSPLYRKELENAFVAISKLENLPKKLNIGTVLKNNTVFEYINQEKEYKIKLKLKYDLKLVIEEGKSPILLLMKSDGTFNSANPIFSTTENCLTVVEWEHKGVPNGVHNKISDMIEPMESRKFQKITQEGKSVEELEKMIFEYALGLPLTGNFIAELALTFENIVKINTREYLIN
jgi:hypothetical protein